MTLLAPEAININNLPSVEIRDIRHLPKESGLYFVIREGSHDVLYIGQSSCLRTRLGSHHLRKTFLNTPKVRVAWILVPYKELSSLEEAVIEFFEPSMNTAKGGNRRPVTVASTYYHFTFRMPPELREYVLRLSAESGAPFNTELIKIMRLGIEAKNKAFLTTGPTTVAVAD